MRSDEELERHAVCAPFESTDNRGADHSPMTGDKNSCWTRGRRHDGQKVGHNLASVLG
jgi:hypothetical protein